MSIKRIIVVDDDNNIEEQVQALVYEGVDHGNINVSPSHLSEHLTELGVKAEIPDGPLAVRRSGSKNREEGP